MSYEVKILPNEPVVYISLSIPYAPLTDVPAAFARAIELAQTIQGPVYLLADISALNLSLDEVIDGMAALRGMLPKDNRFRSLAIGSAEMAKFALKSMKQAQYGNVDVNLFGSLDEALSHVHAELGKPA